MSKLIVDSTYTWTGPSKTVYHFHVVSRSVSGKILSEVEISPARPNPSDNSWFYKKLGRCIEVSEATLRCQMSEFCPGQ